MLLILEKDIGQVESKAGTFVNLSFRRNYLMQESYSLIFPLHLLHRVHYLNMQARGDINNFFVKNFTRMVKLRMLKQKKLL